MNWNNCISYNRTGRPKHSHSTRSHFQRDFDRIIFSSAFRRLQDKTQVFPLPGNTFVHNRLTHSLEVSSVGRSLGHIVGDYTANTVKDLTPESKHFYKYDLSSVIAAACLAHDLGNPPFGHSGEAAISSYFIKNHNTLFEGKRLQEFFTKEEWSDLTNFEGNANALHIITNDYTGKVVGGLSLTYTTLASILKYPCASTQIDKSLKHRKKYGYFKKDQPIFEEICIETNLKSNYDFRFSRHPFVYLVEAADDICYRIIDIEDAHRINILSTSYVIELFISIIKEVDKQNNLDKIKETLNKIDDGNEKVSYLRAKTINALILEAAEVFKNNSEKIINGNWNSTLFDEIEAKSSSLVEAKTISISKIYNSPSIIEIELTGHNIIYELLSRFVPIVVKRELTQLESKSLLLVPNQFKYPNSDNEYQKVIGIIDFISGMTDGYATELYRKFTGISISIHK
jgi:dGTPase